MDIFLLMLALSPTDQHISEADAIYAFETRDECNGIKDMMQPLIYEDEEGFYPHIFCIHAGGADDTRSLNGIAYTMD